MAAGSVPGVQLQAMIADTVLRGFPIREPMRAGFLGRVAEWAGLSGLAFFLLAARRAWRVASLAAVLAALYVAAVFALFPFNRTLLPMVAPVAQVASTALLCLLLRRRLAPFPGAVK